jgi:uncharacterized protein with von Willebrand factor type A (vWA) domain
MSEQPNSMVVTPAMVDRRLYDLSREVDSSHTFLETAEAEYADAKTKAEIQLARVRIDLAKRWSNAGIKATVQEKEDHALVECAEQVAAMGAAEAKVKAARANVQRVRTQVDIARSLGTSVRTGWSAS